MYCIEGSSSEMPANGSVKTLHVSIQILIQDLKFHNSSTVSRNTAKIINVK